MLNDNEHEFLFTDSGVHAADDKDDIELTGIMYTHVFMEEEEDDNDIDIDLYITKEIGKIHKNKEWIPRLWASLANSDANVIIYSIYSNSNIFQGECFITKVHTHDDINWIDGFGDEKSNLIGNGIGFDDHFRGGINSIYRYLNDYFTGNKPGYFSRICGSTASLLGLEASLNEEEKIIKKMELSKNKKKFSQKLNIVKLRIQSSVNRILLLHAVSCSMPSMFMIYYGDEIGKLNDYSYMKQSDISIDSLYLHRGKIDWEKAKLIDSDEILINQKFLKVSNK